MNLQDAHASYWFTEDTKQVRDVAVSVSLSADTAADQAVVRSRIRRRAQGPRRADRFKGL
jgi:hypothetical protein